MRRVLFVVLSAVMLAACSATPPSPTAPTPSPPGATAADPTPATATPAASDLPVLAARPASSGEVKLEFAVRELRAGGGVTTLTWSITNRDLRDSWLPAAEFGDGIYQEGTTSKYAPHEMPPSTTDGVYLIDRSNARRYAPGRDAENGCVCSDVTGVRIQPGETVLLHGVYQALPDAVTAVDVAIPLAGVFTDVPVSR